LHKHPKIKQIFDHNTGYTPGKKSNAKSSLFVIEIFFLNKRAELRKMEQVGKCYKDLRRAVKVNINSMNSAKIKLLKSFLKEHKVTLREAAFFPASSEVSSKKRKHSDDNDDLQMIDPQPTAKKLHQYRRSHFKR